MIIFNMKIRKFNENSEEVDKKLHWDEFLEELKRDIGSNTSIKTTDFRYLEKWLFDRIVNKTVVGDEMERPL